MRWWGEITLFSFLVIFNHSKSFAPLENISFLHLLSTWKHWLLSSKRKPTALLLIFQSFRQRFHFPEHEAGINLSSCGTNLEFGFVSLPWVSCRAQGAQSSQVWTWWCPAAAPPAWMGLKSLQTEVWQLGAQLVLISALPFTPCSSQTFLAVPFYFTKQFAPYKPRGSAGNNFTPSVDAALHTQQWTIAGVADAFVETREVKWTCKLPGTGH